jgi:cellulose synthase/poly-beta-1,6-N-acetylglucosamine synthase-like glycosyltransferase
MADTLFIIWFILNLVLLIFVVHEFTLMFFALTRKNQLKQPALLAYPKVTVQLPVYNEKYVIKRLLQSAENLNYPAEKLEIQILDDSTDETSEIIQSFISNSPRKQLFRHIQRKDRIGFKAGALDYGLKLTDSEFVAIFDADFIIDSEFLQKSMPYFEHEKVGVVQSKWKHINEDFSFITRAQAIMLNTHFSIEQLGRSQANAYINFNGTAGIWRIACIRDAGGWHADTLTEDLDLSYRAQIKGWKFKYLFSLGSPAELPVTFEAYRTQQHRWSKGAAECVRKNAALLWNAPISLRKKTMGFFHLLNSSVYLLIVPLILLSPAIYYLSKNNFISFKNVDNLALIGLLTSSLLISIFFIGNLIGQRNILKRILLFIPSIFMFFAMTSGISFYMLIGVMEGYLNKKSAFVRTPKFGETQDLKKEIKIGYDYKKELSLKFFEIFFLAYGLFMLALAIKDLNLFMGIYGAIISTGFALAVIFKKQTFKLLN